MNAAENNLVAILTGKPSLQEVSVDELKAINAVYPYCSLLQLLLLKKVKQEKPELFTGQWQQCALYFQDVAWLQGQLHSTHIAAPATIHEEADQPIVAVTKVVEEELSSDANTNKILSQETNAIENANLITLPAENVLQDFALQMNDVKDEPEEPPLDDETLANENDNAAQEAASKIAGVLQHQVENYKAPVSGVSEMPVNTEPYHTIDYFASQGIKADAQMQDAFTKKVHTFTDWLRQMKRISSYPADLGSDPEMESYIQSIADTSNQPKAIDTEAMAEVLVKQGKLDKAVQVYKKLSLLNPGKTAYFAAKINHLKGL